VEDERLLRTVEATRGWTDCFEMLKQTKEKQVRKMLERQTEKQTKTD
jgi:hypothetical protein